MKAIQLVGVITFLLLHSVSLAKDPKSKRTDVDFRQNNSLSDRTLRISSSGNLATLKISLTNPHNRGLTSVGGPTTKSKNTAAINGTGIKR